MREFGVIPILSSPKLTIYRHHTSNFISLFNYGNYSHYTKRQLLINGCRLECSREPFIIRMRLRRTVPYSSNISQMFTIVHQRSISIVDLSKLTI
jgi:hypothetical protein